MTDGLKPCPFCGGEARYYAPGPIDHHIECVECYADIHRDTEAEAIAAWNTRAERTCSIEGRYYDELWEETCTRLSCGHEAWECTPKFCPECGAKVIR